MNLPESVLVDIGSELGHVDRIEVLSGGIIAAAFRLHADRETFFLKCATGAPAGFFEVEAAGLDLMRNAGTPLKVPHVVARGLSEGTAWLVLEWLDAGRTPSFSVELGHGLAMLHRQQAGEWGLDRGGYIGSLPQRNGYRDDWVDFWWEERLVPQIQAAEPGFRLGADQDELRRAVARALEPVRDEGPSLLHGDLWSGNVMSTTVGPAIFDPACYFGHREVDLAMTELFGGFDDAFYRAYDETWPRREGYATRRAVYQLYYLLVHVNLFGGSYAARTRDTLRHLLAA